MHTPRVSYALPVRNGEDDIAKVLDSLIAQHFQDWEVVISDNESTDATEEIVRSYAASDARIRWEPNGENIGQIENFNRAADLARGEFMRWIGDDDVLEPEYTGECVAALDAHPEWVAVTTHQDYTDEYGVVTSAVYAGERLDSSDPVRRYERLFFFLSANFRYCDPIYAMIRTDTMRRIGGEPNCYESDQVFVSGLVLDGPVGHIDGLLAHRTKWMKCTKTGKQLAKIANPRKWRRVCWSSWALPGLHMLIRILRSKLSVREQLRCLPALSRHVWRRARYNVVESLRGACRALGLGLVKRWLTRDRVASNG